MTFSCQLLGDCNLRLAGLKGVPASHQACAQNALDPRASSGIIPKSTVRKNIGKVLNTQTFSHYLVLDFDQRFAVSPRSHHNAHRPLLFSEDELNVIFSLQETRILSKNLTLQYNKVIYQIQTTRPTYTLRKAQVTVCENAQGDITILYKGKPLQYSVFHKQQRQAEVLTSKQIDTHLKELKKPPKPAPNHPWRQYGRHLNGKPIRETSLQGGD
ncbi:MAG: hypothetical protein PVG14_17245 [Anaerolineales bacterium]|jgi:hypothetical protein